MEEGKKSNVGVIILTAIICLLLGAAGVYFVYGNHIKENCKPEEVEKPTQTETTNCEEACSVVSDKNSLHVYEHTSSNNGYNIYAYLDNQGVINTILDYNNVLYKVSEAGQSSCVTKLYEGLKFTNNKADCSEDESTSGEVYKFDVNVSDLANAYLIQSFRSDGADFTLLVFKSGKVNRYDFVDGVKVTKDVFADQKVKEVKDYSCSKQGEDGCEKESFKVVLQDGTEKEL